MAGSIVSRRNVSALEMAVAVQKRAADSGFDWPDADGPRDKVREELGELDEAIASHSDRSGQASSVASARGTIPEVNAELGDLLFATVNFARHLGVDPGDALLAAIDKFNRRFGYIEDRLAARGQTPEDVEPACLDWLWEESKRRERDHSASAHHAERW